MKLLQFYVDDLIKRAITEDINYIDSTTDLLIDEIQVDKFIAGLGQGHGRLGFPHTDDVHILLRCVFSHYLTTLSR